MEFIEKLQKDKGDKVHSVFLSGILLFSAYTYIVITSVAATKINNKKLCI
jgi:hypothetical protein